MLRPVCRDYPASDQYPRCLKSADQTFRFARLAFQVHSEPNLQFFFYIANVWITSLVGELDGSKNWFGRDQKHGLRNPAL